MSAVKLATLTLYDLPSQLPEKAWSPNTWKTRYCLNYKGLPHQTEWVEYPDIAALYEKHGVAASDTNADGSPYYTVPLLHDSSTGQFISDSTAIAKYLDETYPDTPKLFPPGINTFVRAYRAAFVARMGALSRFTVPQTFTILNPQSTEYFRRTREIDMGAKMEEITPRG